MTEVHTPDGLLAVLETGAGFDDGERVDLLDHSLQCAATLAESFPDDLELQVAGLVHDIGWLLSAAADTHARTGADAVEPLLGGRVAALVRGHDHAKRYLVSTEPAYREGLSETSVLTLGLQGGDMDAAERVRFEADAHFEDLVRLRRADDAAKVVGRPVPGLDAWRAPVAQLAARR